MKYVLFLSMIILLLAILNCNGQPQVIQPTGYGAQSCQYYWYGYHEYQCCNNQCYVVQ